MNCKQKQKTIDWSKKNKKTPQILLSILCSSDRVHVVVSGVTALDIIELRAELRIQSSMCLTKFCVPIRFKLEKVDQLLKKKYYSSST